MHRQDLYMLDGVGMPFVAYFTETIAGRLYGWATQLDGPFPTPSAMADKMARLAFDRAVARCA
jgi:hypothetical protein